MRILVLIQLFCLTSFFPDGQASEEHLSQTRWADRRARILLKVLSATPRFAPGFTDKYLASRLPHYSQEDVRRLRNYYPAVWTVENFVSGLELEPFNHPSKPGFRLLPKNSSAIRFLGSHSVLLHLPGLCGPHGRLFAKISGFACNSVQDGYIRLQGMPTGGHPFEDNHDTLRATLHFLKIFGISSLPFAQQFRFAPRKKLNPAINFIHPLWFHLVEDLTKNDKAVLSEAHSVLHSNLDNKEVLETELQNAVNRILQEVDRQGLVLTVNRHVEWANPVIALRRVSFVRQVEGSKSGELIVGDLDHIRISRPGTQDAM